MKNQKPFKVLWNKPLQVILPFHQTHNLWTSYGFQVIQNDKTFSPPLIELTLLLTEITSSQTRFSNVEWGLIEDPLNQIQSQFHHYKNKGMGRVLTSSRLITENKKTGKFFLGGEIPTPQYHTKNQTVSTSFKPYGLSLSFTPEVQTHKKIHLQFEVEISEIDNSSKGLKNHRIQSEITIPEGQSLLLSDFQRRSFGQTQPFSFSIPLFGSLFKQKNKEKSKAMIFITPRIMTP